MKRGRERERVRRGRARARKSERETASERERAGKETREKEIFCDTSRNSYAGAGRRFTTRRVPRTCSLCKLFVGSTGILKRGRRKQRSWRRTYVICNLYLLEYIFFVHKDYLAHKDYLLEYVLFENAF